ncbi:MAG: hypothetical protein ABIA02_00280 [Candidatus Falkowbacteria bacterium]
MLLLVVVFLFLFIFRPMEGRSFMCRGRVLKDSRVEHNMRHPEVRNYSGQEVEIDLTSAEIIDADKVFDVQFRVSAPNLPPAAIMLSFLESEEDGPFRTMKNLLAHKRYLEVHKAPKEGVETVLKDLRLVVEQVSGRQNPDRETCPAS